MEKIIFLDIDGVIMSFDNMRADAATAREFPDGFGHAFDSRCVKWLERILKATGASIVISSSWRMIGLEGIKELWEQRFMPGEIIGITPRITNGADNIRGNEINKWLVDNKKEDCIYAIIDDDSDFYPEQKEFLIQTNGNFGLQWSDSVKAIDILNI